jgi:hypothetical protein
MCDERDQNKTQQTYYSAFNFLTLDLLLLLIKNDSFDKIRIKN